MKIKDAIDTIKKESILGRTPIGRPITDKAIAFLDASLQDEKNWENAVITCKNCGIIISSLLVPEGCVNCGSKDLQY